MKRVTLVLEDSLVGKLLAEYAGQAAEVHVTSEDSEPSVDLGPATRSELQRLQRTSRAGSRKSKKSRNHPPGYVWKGSERLRQAVLDHIKKHGFLNRSGTHDIAREIQVSLSAIEAGVRGLFADEKLVRGGDRKHGYIYRIKDEAA